MDKVSPIKLYDENKSIAGFNLRKLLFNQDNHEYVRTLVETVFKLWEKKKIHPIIDSIFAFEDVADAMQKMHDRRNVGKIILDPAAEAKPKPVPEEGAEAEKKPARTSLLRKLSTKTTRENATSGQASGTQVEAKKEEEEKKDANGSKEEGKKEVEGKK